MSHRLRALRVLGIGLGLAALLALPGCGGSDEGSPKASASPGGGNAAGASGDNDQLVEYAKCLRGQGVDVPDPKPGQTLMDLIQSSGVDTGRLREANVKCQDKLPDGVRERAGSQETQDQMLKFAQCMRRNGVDMPDPKGGQLDFGTVDRNSPKFEEAEKKCRQEVVIGQGG